MRSAPLPSIEEIQQRGTKDNPDLRAALEAVRQSRYDVFGARMGYLPSLSFDYFYGIDATRFAVNAELANGKKYSNVGYSWLATLNIPIWNWGTTQSKVKQAELKQDQAKREFSLAQRKLIAEIQSLYAEASTALSELEDLKRSGELAVGKSQAGHTSLSKRRSYGTGSGGRTNDFCHAQTPLIRMAHCAIA